jgi:outer membrane protein OmpA-like peptidoglycan-associated protein
VYVVAVVSNRKHVAEKNRYKIICMTFVFRLFFCHFFFFCFSFLVAQGQEVQWAYRLLGFSSEYAEGANPNPYSAKQVLGRPNKMPAEGFSPVAWSPLAADRSVQEWIKVGFRKQMKIRQLAVAENCNAGSISQVFLYDTEGNEYEIFKDTLLASNKSKDNSQKAKWFRLFFPLTTYNVAAAKVVLNPIKVVGRNQLDAIGIADTEQIIEATINVVEPKNQAGEQVQKPEKLPTTINTTYNELLPVISPDGKTLFFDRKAHPENTKGQFVNDDIWFATMDNTGNFGVAQRLPAPINNENHNYVCSVGADGRSLLLANSYQEQGTSNPQNTGGISISKKTAEGNWTMPEKVIIENYQNISPYAEFQLASNQKVMLLGIEEQQGYGNRDLYVSFLKSDQKTWTSPQNLGSIINTAASEITPFLAADNKTLYFASNGFSGYGDMDMFMSKRLDDTWTNWTEPVNLGKPFNTNDWDAAYSLDAKGEFAYFVGYENGQSTDIFRAKIPTWLRPENTEKPQSPNILPQKLEVGQVLQLKNVFFEQGTPNLLSNSYTELNTLVRMMNESPTLEIEIIGHTDIEGSPIENMQLSKDRVRVIKDYLTKQGILVARLKTKAFGSQQPLSRKRDENSKQLNRRVEIKVLKK